MTNLQRDIAERVFWTFVATVCGILVSWPAFDLADMSMWKAAATAGVVAAFTFLKGAAAAHVGDATAALPLMAITGGRGISGRRRGGKAGK